ncbi:MAG: hypothetical protein CSB48_10940 [Proteobacteria bacterium]|nr:MAG: hypothetical protein CSB48_10940 [Pseudomonadota bacterium]PIE40089.1 MAG: hypothetical protein CSA51_02705 [Gammaproteobacteria bacterium]
MDSDSLYREEVVTDQKIGTIRIMTPINANGDTDNNRKVQYIGQAQMMTPAGALPLTFELEADNLADAIEQFSDAAQVSMEKTIEELKEYRRQQASSIVVPGSGGMPPGGGKIQMP